MKMTLKIAREVLKVDCLNTYDCDKCPISLRRRKQDIFECIRIVQEAGKIALDNLDGTNWEDDGR